MAESDVSSSESEYEDPDDHTYVEPSERRKRHTGPVTKQQRPRKRAPPRSASAPDPRCLEDRESLEKDSLKKAAKARKEALARTKAQLHEEDPATEERVRDLAQMKRELAALGWVGLGVSRGADISTATPANGTTRARRAGIGQRASWGIPS